MTPHKKQTPPNEWQGLKSTVGFRRVLTHKKACVDYKARAGKSTHAQPESA